MGMTRHILPTLAVALAIVIASSPAQACGADTDCSIGDRTYRIKLPDGQDGTSSVGALIFAHGYKGSAGGTMKNQALHALANRLGVALVAPDAIMDDWSLPNAPSGGTSTEVDELAYFDALRADLTSRHGIDPAQSIVAGFSAGGMMVWTLACARPQDYAGFIPIAGTFWHPVPPDCAMPAADIIHIHGTSDKIVPLAGRPIAETKQGDVAETFGMYLDLGGFFSEPAAALSSDLTCESWRNVNDATVMKCLHSGGHSFKASYLESAWNLLIK